MTPKTLLLAGLALAAAGPAFADPRIRKVAYDPDAVVRLDGCFGFQTLVEFAPDERIENVGLGDAAQWLVSPNKRADMLFVKPAYRSSHSNMTVATSRRRYNFELSAQASEACRRGAVTYSLRFTYKDAPQATPLVATAAMTPLMEPEVPAPSRRNAAYTFTGAKDDVPVRVFDDGRATFFRWNEGTSTPAIYAVAADKTESLVSLASRGDWLVAEQVAPAYVLRRGNAVAVLYNDAYQTPQLDAGSPQLRTERTADAGSSRPGLFGRRSANR